MYVKPHAHSRRPSLKISVSVDREESHCRSYSLIPRVNILPIQAFHLQYFLTYNLHLFLPKPAEENWDVYYTQGREHLPGREIGEDGMQDKTATVLGAMVNNTTTALSLLPLTHSTGKFLNQCEAPLPNWAPD